MLEEALNFATLCMYLIMPGTLITMLLYSLFDWYKTNDSQNIVKNLKASFCTMLSILISVVILIQMIIQIFQVSKIWEENKLDSFSKASAIFGVVGTWEIIGAIMILCVWKFIYMNQIISGSGSISQRLKNIYSSRNVVSIILCVITACIIIVIAVFAFFNIPVGLPYHDFIK
jgi:hypothetical protein